MLGPGLFAWLLTTRSPHAASAAVSAHDNSRPSCSTMTVWGFELVCVARSGQAWGSDCPLTAGATVVTMRNIAALVVLAQRLRPANNDAKQDRNVAFTTWSPPFDRGDGHAPR
jgi:hypothetical protein